MTPTILPADVFSALDPRSLELTILPTEKCNFRCTYCYEDFKIGRMSASTLSAVKQLLTRRSQALQRLHISWFGGEPLLAKQVVLEISRHVSSMRWDAAQFQYTGHMTTNGYLLDLTTLQELFDVGVQQFQITLDGNEAFHNRTRLRSDHAGTFQRIWRNLMGIRSSALEVHVTLFVHYSPDSLEGVIPLLQQINSSFGGDQRFRVLLKAIERLGGANDADIQIFSPTLDKEVQHHLYGLLNHSHLRSDLNNSGNAYICYAAKPNHLLIRANGQLAKCTVGFDTPSNQLGHLNPDGTLQIDMDKFRYWIRGFGTYNLEQLACPLHSDELEKHPIPPVNTTSLQMGFVV